MLIYFSVCDYFNCLVSYLDYVAPLGNMKWSESSASCVGREKLVTKLQTRRWRGPGCDNVAEEPGRSPEALDYDPLRKEEGMDKEDQKQ